MHAMNYNKTSIISNYLWTGKTRGKMTTQRQFAVFDTKMNNYCFCTQIIAHLKVFTKTLSQVPLLFGRETWSAEKLFAGERYQYQVHGAVRTRLQRRASTAVRMRGDHDRERPAGRRGNPVPRPDRSRGHRCHRAAAVHSVRGHGVRGQRARTERGTRARLRGDRSKSKGSASSRSVDLYYKTIMIIIIIIITLLISVTISRSWVRKCQLSNIMVVIAAELRKIEFVNTELKSCEQLTRPLSMVTSLWDTKHFIFIVTFSTFCLQFISFSTIHFVTTLKRIRISNRFLYSSLKKTRAQFRCFRSSLISIPNKKYIYIPHERFEPISIYLKEI